MSARPDPMRLAVKTAGRQVKDDDEKRSKYTVLLPLDEAADFDALALKARREVGRVVDKSRIVRALLLLAADDPELLGRVLARVDRLP